MNEPVVLQHVVVSPVCCYGPVLAPEYIIPTTASLLPIFHCETNPPTAAPSSVLPTRHQRADIIINVLQQVILLTLMCSNAITDMQFYKFWSVCLTRQDRRAVGLQRSGAGCGLKRQQAGRRTDSSQSAVWVNTTPPEPEIQKTRHESCVTAGR